MSEFIHVKIPDTIIGPGTVGQIGDMVKKMDVAKILVLTDAGINKAGLIDRIITPLEKAELKFQVFDGCKAEPSVSLLEEISGKAGEKGHELIIGVGGGSVMDTAKVVSATARSGMGIKEYISIPFHEKIPGRVIPKLLVPTTAGTGSEWSVVTTVYDHGKGRVHVIQARQNIPDKVIIDPELTFDMPARLTADTGMDALVHAIEAYTSAAANIFSDMLATTAIKMISENLRAAYAKGGLNKEARCNMSIAAAMAMNAVVTGGIGLSHIINDVLGPKARISHGTTVSLTLPAVMEYNLIADPGKFARIAELMGEYTKGMSTMDAALKSVQAVKELMKDLNLPVRLREVGIKESDIPELAKKCCDAEQPVIDAVNPRDATEQDVAGILRASL